MGIQINGQTDTVTSTSAGGSVKVTPLAASTGLNVGTGASISSPATNVLTLGTNNVESVRIDSSGNVGINSTSPRSKLDVGGDLTLGRIDSSIEGGQVSLCRSTDNATAWSMDVYGSTSTPSLRFVDGIAAASRMSIDGSGRVTMPYQPAFCARTVGSVSPLSGNIVLNTIILNNGNHYSTSTGNFTAPIAGMYYFSFTGFTENSSSGSADISIQKNGTSVVRTYTSEATGTYRPFAVDCIVSLAANDTVRPNSGIEIHGNLNPNFSGFLIG